MFVPSLSWVIVLLIYKWLKKRRVFRTDRVVDAIVSRRAVRGVNARAGHVVAGGLGRTVAGVLQPDVLEALGDELLRVREVLLGVRVGRQVAGAVDVDLHKTRFCFSAFSVFVPSLCWQSDRF